MAIFPRKWMEFWASPPRSVSFTRCCAPSLLNQKRPRPELFRTKTGQRTVTKGLRRHRTIKESADTGTPAIPSNALAWEASKRGGRGQYGHCCAEDWRKGGRHDLRHG